MARCLLRQMVMYKEPNTMLIRRQRFWKWWDTWSSYVIGAFLLGIGLGLPLIPFAPVVFQSNAVHRLSEAMMIAGLLAFAVDPLVKGKAQREATRDIFHHMLGFALPLPIRDRLQQIVHDTTIYRENTVMHVTLSEKGPSIVFDVELDYDIINPTQHPFDFEPIIEFDRGEHGTLNRVICFGEPGYGKDTALRPNSDEPLMLEYHGESVRLRPDERRRFRYEYTTEYPASLGYYFQHFKYPTIGFSLTVICPPNLDVTSAPTELHDKNCWRYPRLFMPGDHLNIRWEWKTTQ